MNFASQSHIKLLIDNIKILTPDLHKRLINFSSFLLKLRDVSSAPEQISILGVMITSLPPLMLLQFLCHNFCIAPDASYKRMMSQFMIIEEKLSDRLKRRLITYIKYFHKQVIENEVLVKYCTLVSTDLTQWTQDQDLQPQDHPQDQEEPESDQDQQDEDQPLLDCTDQHPVCTEQSDDA